jgi:DNA repair photolyase
VKTNLVEVLRRELARRRWAHETVVIGAATDPYQPAEGRYRLTRRSIEALAEARNPLSIITRGPLIVRDVDVLVEAARQAPVSVTFSVPTLDPAIVATTEPILPGLSDRPELLADVVKAARDAGATAIWTNVLHLRPGTREHFLAHLGQDWPELVPRYQRLYAGRAYLGKDVTEPLRREVTELRERFEIADRRRIRILPVAAPREPEQLSLEAAGLGDAPAPAARSA